MDLYGAMMVVAFLAGALVGVLIVALSSLVFAAYTLHMLNAMDDPSPDGH